MNIGVNAGFEKTKITIGEEISNSHEIVIPRGVTRFGGKGKTYIKYHNAITRMAMENNLDTFVDCFGGGGTMSFLASQLLVPDSNQLLFNTVIYNEIEPGVAATYKVLKSEEETMKLVGYLLKTPYCKEVFNEAKKVCEDANEGGEYDDLEIAYYSFLLNNLSYNGAGNDFRDYQKYKSTINYEQVLYRRARNLLDVVPYMQRIEVRRGDYKEVLSEYQLNSRALLFLDPPYLAAERAVGASEVYMNEMWNIEHIFMNNYLSQCWNWILCGYRGKAQGAESMIYGFLEQQPGVEVIDLGAIHRHGSNKSMTINSPHEYIWQRSLSEYKNHN